MNIKLLIAMVIMASASLEGKLMQEDRPRRRQPRAAPMSQVMAQTRLPVQYLIATDPSVARAYVLLIHPEATDARVRATRIRNARGAMDTATILMRHNIGEINFDPMHVGHNTIRNQVIALGSPLRVRAALAGSLNVLEDLQRQ